MSTTTLNELKRFVNTATKMHDTTRNIFRAKRSCVKRIISQTGLAHNQLHIYVHLSRNALESCTGVGVVQIKAPYSEISS